MPFQTFFGILETNHYTGDGSNSIRSEHEGWEILTLLSKDRATTGNGQLTSALEVHGKKHLIEPNSALLYNGRDRHTSIHKGLFQYHSLNIAEDYVDGLLAGVQLNARELIFEKVGFQLTPAHKELLQNLLALQFIPNLSKATVDTFVTEFLVDCILRLPTSATSQLRKFLGSGHYPSIIEKTKKCLLENIHQETFDLEDLASQVGMSRFHLIRTFRKAVGHSPMQYRALIRNDLAKRHLLNGRQSILQLSESLGFGNLSTFNKSFKRLNRLSPTEFSQRFSPAESKEQFFPSFTLANEVQEPELEIEENPNERRS